MFVVLEKDMEYDLDYGGRITKIVTLECVNYLKNIKNIVMVLPYDNLVGVR